MKIVGLDLSLTSTGIAVITDAGTTTHTVESDATSNDLPTRIYRIAGIAANIYDYIAPGADLVLIEGPSLHSKYGRPWERAGLWWHMVRRLVQIEIPVVEVTPSCLKKYATGKGNIAKEKVLLAVVRRYPQVEVANNNEADALCLAALGARWLGCPIDDPLPKLNLEAMKGIRWPEAMSVS